ncbi:MAG: hypothetical protein GQ582_10525 [Methyloprofundus sp.]|nr:hypothetical protein [Methyloprofundus sp.]
MSDFTNTELIFLPIICFIVIINLIKIILKLTEKTKRQNKKPKQKKSSHEQLMDRLINYELSRTPGISRKEARARAYRRWERDNKRYDS